MNTITLTPDQVAAFGSPSVGDVLTLNVTSLNKDGSAQASVESDEEEGEPMEPAENSSIPPAAMAAMKQMA